MRRQLTQAKLPPQRWDQQRHERAFLQRYTTGRVVTAEWSGGTWRLEQTRPCNPAASANQEGNARSECGTLERGARATQCAIAIQHAYASRSLRRLACAWPTSPWVPSAMASRCYTHPNTHTHKYRIVWWLPPPVTERLQNTIATTSTHLPTYRPVRQSP